MPCTKYSTHHTVSPSRDSQLVQSQPTWEGDKERMDFDAIYSEYIRYYDGPMVVSRRRFIDMMETARRGKLLSEYRPSHEMLVECMQILEIDGSTLVPRHKLCARIYRKLGVPRPLTDVYRYQQEGTDFRRIPGPRFVPRQVQRLANDQGAAAAATTTTDTVQNDGGGQNEPALDELDAQANVPDIDLLQNRTHATADAVSSGNLPSSSGCSGQHSGSAGEEPVTGSLEEVTTATATKREEVLHLIYRAVHCLTTLDTDDSVDELNQIANAFHRSSTRLIAIEMARRRLVQEERARKGGASSLECPICANPGAEDNRIRAFTRCGHIMCTNCVHGYLNSLPYTLSAGLNAVIACPMCREDSRTIQLFID